MTIERGIIGPPAPADARRTPMTKPELVSRMVKAKKTILSLTGLEGDDITLRNEELKRSALNRFNDCVDIAYQQRLDVPGILSEVERRLTPTPELPTR